MIKKFFELLIIFIISAIIVSMGYGIYKEAKLSKEPKTEGIVNTANSEQKESNDINVKAQLISTEYKGYKVSAKIQIPKIDLETYVFEEYDEEAMWICPTKYFGPAPNEVGNYCIAAHNYNKKNMFNHIIELEEGDEIILSDNKNGSVKYAVYDVYKVKPTQVEVLSQETNGKTEMTLITCSDYSSNRIIVKARKTEG